MNNKALLNFINEACKQDDTDIDISIAELTSAIHTLEKEKEKRETKKRSILVDNFRKAYLALRDNHISIAYDFNAEYTHEMYHESSAYSDEVRLTLDDFASFAFDF